MYSVCGNDLYSIYFRFRFDAVNIFLREVQYAKYGKISTSPVQTVIHLQLTPIVQRNHLLTFPWYHSNIHL